MCINNSKSKEEKIQQKWENYRTLWNKKLETTWCLQKSNLLAEILYFQLKGDCNTIKEKKKVCLTLTLPETTENKSGERSLQ